MKPAGCGSPTLASARLEADAGMTMTGDLVGTLRYMSPEQALAKRVVVDHRTDVYSLGVTLFELLALRPAFDGEDRQHLLKQIAFEDPPHLRKLNRQIPAELETIVEKAIRKNPEERYATAHDLAEDLRSYLANRPIKAKPPSWRAGAQMVATTSSRSSGHAGCRIRHHHIYRRKSWLGACNRAVQRTIVEQQILQSLKESKAWYESGKLTEATSAVKRAEELLASDSGSGAKLQEQVGQWQSDLEAVNRLEQIRLDQALPAIARKDRGLRRPNNASQESANENEDGQDGDLNWDWVGANRAYQEQFLHYGLNLDAIDVEKSAQLIRNSPIKQSLVAALDDWFWVTQFVGSTDTNKSSGKTELLQIARLADPDPCATGLATPSSTATMPHSPSWLWRRTL